MFPLWPCQLNDGDFYAISPDYLAIGSLVENILSEHESLIDAWNAANELKRETEGIGSFYVYHVDKSRMCKRIAYGFVDTRNTIPGKGRMI